MGWFSWTGRGLHGQPGQHRFLRDAPDSAIYPGLARPSHLRPRAHFDLPSKAGPRGPSKEIAIERPGKIPVFLSIFPDRDADEDHSLTVELIDAAARRQTLRLPVHVVDQDVDGPLDRSRPAALPITVNYSHDRTGFFRIDAAKQKTVERAASDGPYYFDGSGLDSTPAGAETTLIWGPEGFSTSRQVTNNLPFAGYLLYAYGIDGPELRSGGEASRFGGFQLRTGRIASSPGIRRLRGRDQRQLQPEGLARDLGDSDWWRATNLSDVENDLYSIAHHEIGHALIFNHAHVRFEMAKQAERLRDERVHAYLGTDPAVNQSDHLACTIDPSSLQGAFGNEYHGRVPLGRWLITKLEFCRPRLWVTS